MDISVIKKYFPNLTEKQLDQLERLPVLYTEWNEKINVVSRKDIDALMERHILHSLSIALFFDLNKNLSILDIGTGGGFPGIPLAIINPQSQFTLIDSIGKKIKVVNEVAQSIGLTNCKGLHENAKNHGLQYDRIVSRAVTALEPFLTYSLPLLKPKKDSCILYLKGGDLSEELKNVQKKCTVFNLQNSLSEPFFETKKIVKYTP